jgi:hypothetical protein
MKVNRQEVGFVYGCLYYSYDVLVRIFAHFVSGACILLFGLFLGFLPWLLTKGLFFLVLNPLAQTLKFLYSLVV